ncbi:permease [Methanotrichaceae archaeon M04Ac]|uniref:Permease n=2 Tax=Candidatus Methanocrinis alkalitolerans TaxID=3033395 RepID=A0ABT5XEJ4_9EURY|nr:permease [Candidatus Methanocrinis alkalitolerans]MDF0593061.1 permease [Candidatus Methanocrinis alkalitolerans]
MNLEIVLPALAAGFEALMEYLSAHVLTCLIPAFFIAGAIAALLQREAVLKYFGRDAPKWLCYSVASTSGTILAVCSCTILPMFAGIHRRGAGIGPATAFLFAGPAINLLAVVLTARVLGLELGAARIAAAVSMAVIIGLVMAAVFERGERVAERAAAQACAIPESEGVDERPGYIPPLFVGVLVAVLLAATSGLAILPKAVIVGILVLASAWLLMRYFTDGEKASFFGETWWLTKRIFPLLLVGTFVAGIIGYYLPVELIRMVFGESDFAACFVASMIGALLYMPTLLEVPIVGTMFGYSTGAMAPGPALALLLAGPSMSLPNMIVIWRIIGSKRAAVYITLVVLLSTLMGMIYGMVAS